MDCAGSALRLIRSPNHATTSPVDEVALFRLKSGRVAADYGGRKADLMPGDMVFIDYALAQRSESSSFQCEVLTIPRDEAPTGLRDGRLHGVRVGAESALGQLLGANIASLFANVSALHASTAEVAVASLFGLAASVWPDGDERAVRSAPLALDQALAFIDANLVEPKLGPEYLRRSLQVSRTTLYRMFAPLGGISAAILKRRLDAAVVALVDATPRPGLVKHVAQSYGFSSSRQLIRAVRARFDLTPAEIAALQASEVGGSLFTDWANISANDEGQDTVANWLKGRRETRR